MYFGAANVVAHAMLNRWYGHGVSIEPDGDHEVAERIDGYSDVTREAIEAYNASRPVSVTSVKFEERG